MKLKLCLCISLLFMETAVFAQNAKIIGNITDNAYASIILSPAVYSKLIDSKTEISSKRGAFEFNIQVNHPCFYRLYYRDKRISIYIEPKKTVQVSIDNGKEIEFANFYGDLSTENTFLNQGEIPMIGTPAQRENFKKIAKESESSYMNAVKTEMSTQRDAFKQLASSAGLSPEFIDLYEKNNIDMAGLLYQSYFARFGSSNPDSFIVQNPTFLDIFKALPAEKGYESSLLFYENQMNALKSRVNLRYKEPIIHNKTDDLELYKSYIREANGMPESLVKTYLIENLIGEWVSYYGRTVDIKDEIYSFTNSIPNEAKKEAVKKKLINLAQYETGKPAPIFSFEDNAGNVRNLKEFVGKLVFIDVWASWCGPCIAEIPFSKTVYQKYKNNPDIQFLTLSIDENKENWEKALRMHQLNDGIQGISFPGGFNSDFAKKYSIQGIPSYILIDKSGNMVNHKAPSPSQTEKLYKLLDNLLNINQK